MYIRIHVVLKPTVHVALNNVDTHEQGRMSADKWCSLLSGAGNPPPPPFPFSSRSLERGEGTSYANMPYIVPVSKVIMR